MASNGQMVPYGEKVKSVRALLQKAEAQIKNALPSHIKPEYMIRVVMTEVQKNPTLLDCDPRSFLGGVIVASQLGLEIGVQGQAWLVPFKNNKTGMYEVQLIPGYRGLVSLARRSGEIDGFEARVVHKSDNFKVRLGTSAEIIHEPYGDPEGDPGVAIGAYAVATFKSGYKQFEYMSLRDILAIEKRSKSRGGPWATDREEMFKKTPSRRLCKWLPSSVQLSRVQTLDDQAFTGESQGLGDALEFDISNGKEEAPPKTALEAATERMRKDPPPTDGDGKPLEPWQLKAIEDEKAEAEKSKKK